MLSWQEILTQRAAHALQAEQSMLLAELEPPAELLQRVLVAELGLGLVLVLAAHGAELKPPVELALPVDLG